MRFIPMTLVVVLSACKPPIVDNSAPGLEIEAPTAGELVLADVPVPFVVTIYDRDSTDLTLTVRQGDAILAELEGEPGETLEFSVTPTGTISATLTLSLSDGVQVRDFEHTLALNTPPSDFEVTITPEGSIFTDTPLEATHTESTDPDVEGPLHYDFVWTNDMDATTIAGATLDPDETTKGETWTVVVRACEPWATNPDLCNPNEPYAEASDSVFIENSPPNPPTAVSIVPPYPTTANDLSCEASLASDADGDSLSYSYQWKLDGVDTAYTESTLSNVALSVGQWTCESRAFDGELYSDPFGTSVDILIDTLAADDAPAVLYGDAVNQRFGSSAVCSSIFDNGLTQSDWDDLVVGVPGYSAPNINGLAAVYQGNVLVSGSIGDREGAVQGGTVRWLDGTLFLLPDRTGDPDNATWHEAELVARGKHSESNTRVLYLINSNGVVSDTTVTSTMIQIESDAGSTTFADAFAAGSGSSTDSLRLAVNETSTERVFWLTDSQLGSASMSPTCHPANVTCLRTEGKLQIDSDAGIGFGRSLAVGDLDGDGAQDLLVASDIGVYYFSGTDLNDVAPMTPADASIFFEYDGAISDLQVVSATDGDFGPGFLVGDAGQSTVYYLEIGALSGDVDLVDSALVSIVSSDADADFGADIAVIGDLGTDGIPEIAIGAPSRTVNALTNAGSVYLFSGEQLADAADYTEEEAIFTVEGEALDDRLTVDGAGGDLNLDGFLDWFAISPSHGTSDQGRVYVFLSETD